MAAGYAIDKTTLDNHVGNIVSQLRQTFSDIRQLKTWFDENNDAVLTALGYTAADITLLRNSVTDLHKLTQISAGLAVQPAASDFFFFARRLTGLR